MKKSFLLLMAMVSLFYYSEKANAGLLLEPFAGMEVSSTGDANGTDVDITGSAVGARLGFQNLGFMFGLDARRNSWNLEADSSDGDFTFTQLGLFVGYDFPIMLRVWGNYVFSLNGEDEGKNKYTEGSGLVLGLGYKVIPFVSVNFEMSNTKTTKYKSDTSGNEGDLDYKYSSYLLSVSFPLSL